MPYNHATLNNKIEMHAQVPPEYPLPIAFSIPFPAKHVTDISNLKITKNGNDIPAQFRALNHWSDGSLKWVQGIANTSETFHVHYNEGSSKSKIQNPIQAHCNENTATLTDSQSTLTVDLKTCTATFSYANQSLDFSLSQLTDQNGIPFQAQNATAEIIENGPIRSCIRLRGEHLNDAQQSFLRFDILISLYTGIPVLQINHVVGLNNNTSADFLSLKSLDIPINVTQAKIHSIHTSTDKDTPFTLPKQGRLFQCEDNQFEITDHKQTIQDTGTRANGTLIADTTAGNVFLAIPEFWQQYPKGIATQETGFNIELFPRLDTPNPNRYANRENEHIWYYYLRDDVYTLRQGMEKSHTLYIGFDSEKAYNHQTLRTLQTLPIALPKLDDLIHTEAMGALIPPNSTFAQWDHQFQSGFENYINKLEKERWYGLLNWGDWFGEREFNWGNLEYDAPASFFRQALRFQNPDYFWQAVRAAQHYIDIDTVSQHHNKADEGRVWAHALGHSGGYYESGTFQLNNYDMSDAVFHTGRSSPGHTRCEGVSLLYLLTGDPRALEHVRKIANYLTTHPLITDATPWKTTAREPGWAMVSLIAAYECTGDQTYLNAAQKIADLVLKLADGKGVWHRPLKSRNCMFTQHPDHPQCHGELSFPIAFQSAGMIRVYEHTGRSDIRDNILAAAQYVMDHIYDPEQKGFKHSPCPLRPQSRKIGGITGTNMWIPLAFAYHETHDANILKAIQDTYAQTATQNMWFENYPEGPPQRFTGSILFMPMIQSFLNVTDFMSTK